MALTRAEIAANHRANWTPEQHLAVLEYKKQWRAKNKDKHFQHSLTPYGLTVESYEKMLADQANQCKLCDKRIERANSGHALMDTACVDHCHATGKVRGLLCAHCNKALGLFKDSAEALRRAADYLETNQ